MPRVPLTVIFTATMLACHPTPICPPTSDGGTKLEQPCVKKDACGEPLLDAMGRPIPLPEGSPCKLGGQDGTCQQHECVLSVQAKE